MTTTSALPATPFWGSARYSLIVGLWLILLGTIAHSNPLIVDRLLEGQEVDIPSPTGVWRLKLLIVSDTIQTAIFSLNGEHSKPLKPRERYVFSDGSILALGNILPNEAGERTGSDLVEFYFVGSSKPQPFIRRWTPFEEDTEYDLTGLEDEGVPLSLPPPVRRINQQSSTSTQSSIAPPALSLPGTEKRIVPTCITDEDCDDHDGCTVDVCLGAPRSCRHSRTFNGCSFGSGYCVPYGRNYLIPPDTSVYCTLSGDWKEQATTGNACQADYECSGGACTNGVCSDISAPPRELPQEPSPPRPTRGVWDVIIQFFNRLFSK